MLTQMPMPIRRPAPALPVIPPQDLRASPNVPRLTLQPHNAASVLELSRSLEFEHEVRHEVTLQVMRWFGVGDADERWKMDVVKVVRRISLGILRQYKVGFERFVFPPFDPNFGSGWYL